MFSRHVLRSKSWLTCCECNRIDQLLHPPWFLSQYQKWWNLDTLSLASVEFAILFLRVCCYSSLFLPSPSHTIDSVKGVSLVNIRRSCEEVIKDLLPISRQLDPRGSLVRVQYIAFAGLASISVGPMDAFWEHVSCASRVAQQIGLHLDSVLWPESMDGIEKEMRRRMFCNLYVWDRYATEPGSWPTISCMSLLLSLHVLTSSLCVVAFQNVSTDYHSCPTMP